MTGGAQMHQLRRLHRALHSPVMKMWRALSMLVVLWLTSCAPQQEVFPPDTEVRDAARAIDLKDVASVQLHLSENHVSAETIEVTQPETIRALVEGLKTATKTGIGNQTSQVLVVGRNGESLVYADFSLVMPSHALSPEFVAGLRKAGVKRMPWEHTAMINTYVLTFGAVASLVLVAAAWLLARRIRGVA